MARPDYDRSRWYGADPGNYSDASRGAGDISRIIVHVTQGSWSSAINWFRDPRAGVSAHYTVRSSDGFVGQSVEERDIAYHAGNWTYNRTSIGVEHEGYVDNPGWFTGEMYRSSARLSAYLCEKYNIPADREHILGHNQVPGATHTDPGRNWNWSRYMRLVRDQLNPQYSQVVDNSATGTRFKAHPRIWPTSSYSSQKRGGNYRYSDAGGGLYYAYYKFRIPSRAVYRVYGWWPANSGYNPRTTFGVKHVTGWINKTVDQRRNGGQWVYLGRYAMRSGDYWNIRVASRSPRRGYIIADAVKIIRE